MSQLLWIALGSAIGGTLRYAFDQVAISLGQGLFPVSTLVINLSGSFLIGFLTACIGGAAVDVRARHFWLTGVCGGYTTFSVFSWQILQLIQNGHATLAGLYAAASVGIGLIAVWVGLSFAQTSAKQEKN